MYSIELIKIQFQALVIVVAVRSHYLQGGAGAGPGFDPVSGLDPGSMPQRDDGGRLSLSSKSGFSSSARFQKSSYQLAILKV